MRRRPLGVRDQLRPGASACGAEGAAGVAGEVEVEGEETEPFFKIPFGGAAGVDADAGNSSMSSLDEDLEAVEDAADEPWRRVVGTRTVRGLSLPLEAMLGVPIWRERRREYWASIRWKASSDARVSQICVFSSR